MIFYLIFSILLPLCTLPHSTEPEPGSRSFSRQTARLAGGVCPRTDVYSGVQAGVHLNLLCKPQSLPQLQPQPQPQPPIPTNASAAVAAFVAAIFKNLAYSSTTFQSERTSKWLPASQLHGPNMKVYHIKSQKLSKQETQQLDSNRRGRRRGEAGEGQWRWRR